jgi:hypothetical protein
MTYVFEVTGEASAPLIPLVDHEYNFRVTRSGTTIAQGHLWTGDIGEGSFTDRFPKHMWYADNIFRFQALGSWETEAYDTIRISNKTERLIKFVKVVYWDRFIVLELGPGMSTSVRAPRDSTGWLFVEVLQEGVGKPIFAERAFGWSKVERLRGSINISVDVTDSGLVLQAAS